MPSNITINIENRKNTGTNPNTDATLPHDGKAHKIGDLALNPKPTTSGIMATHVSFNAPSDAQGVIIRIEGGPRTDHGSGYKINLQSGQAPQAVSDGNAMDIAGWYVEAN